MTRIGRYLQAAMVLAVFPLETGMRVLGLIVHETLELAEDLRGL